MGEHTPVERVNELEESILAVLRRAHDEFAMNGFDSMAITISGVVIELRDLASIARRIRNVGVNADLVTALRYLSNEVLGSLPLMEPLARQEFGNTNYNLLIQRAEEARAALARAES